MPRLNLSEATRNLADANIGQCCDCGTPWNDDDLGPRCERCEAYFEDMDMAYFDDLYLRELEAEEDDRNHEEYWHELFGDLPDATNDYATDLLEEPTWDWDDGFPDDDDDDDLVEDPAWDWDNSGYDPWAAMDYNHEKAAA